MENLHEQLKAINDELYQLAIKRHKGKDEYNQMQSLLDEKRRLEEKLKGGD